jgi:hypothetical protein
MRACVAALAALRGSSHVHQHALARFLRSATSQDWQGMYVNRPSGDDSSAQLRGLLQLQGEAVQVAPTILSILGLDDKELSHIVAV